VLTIGFAINKTLAMDSTIDVQPRLDRPADFIVRRLRSTDVTLENAIAVHF
jgi:hypothetical protein